MTERYLFVLLGMLILAGCATRDVNDSQRVGQQSTALPAPTVEASLGGSAAVTAGLYSVHLYRHAEKADGPDPELTPMGHARARHLAEKLSAAMMAVRQVWSSPYRRTMQTAQPVADALSIDVDLYDPRDPQALVAKLKSAAADAVVIGHSNTIPELASMLCGCEVQAMTDEDYETAYVVVLGHGVNELYRLDMKQTWADRPLVQN